MSALLTAEEENELRVSFTDLTVENGYLDRVLATLDAEREKVRRLQEALVRAISYTDAKNTPAFRYDEWDAALAETEPE